MSDIHSDFETFDKALKVVKDSGADILAITGDLYGNWTIKERGESKIEQEMLRYYKEFKDRFNELEQQVLLVPGNWDGKCINDVLSPYNLHLKNPLNIQGIEFVGYGSSDAIPSVIPENLLVGFNQSECYSHLIKYGNAEIALTHETPRGFSGDKRYGQPCISKYIKNTAPSLLMTGHSHIINIAAEQEDETLITNPGNLGRYGRDNFGTFFELEIDENLFVHPKKIYKIDGNDVRICRI